MYGTESKARFSTVTVLIGPRTCTSWFGVQSSDSKLNVFCVRKSVPLGSLHSDAKDGGVRREKEFAEECWL